MAGRYICPVCDRRLQMKHFCTYCKSFVKEPVYYTGPVANESYDSGCMADQHYGLGHVHSPLDRQREYGHHKAGTGTRQNPSARQNTYAQGSRPARPTARTGQRAGYGVKPARGQAGGPSYGGVRLNSASSARAGQSSSRQQTEGASRRVKKFFVVFFVAFVIIMLAEVVFVLIGSQSIGLAGEAVSLIPFTFVWQFLNVVFQVGFFALIIWAVVWMRNIRRK